MVSRKDVYEIIDSERDYQAQMWGEVPHSPAEWVLYMEDYIAEVRGIAARTADDVGMNNLLCVVRKIAAMSVSCMGQHGAPHRCMKDLERAKELHGIEPRGVKND